MQGPSAAQITPNDGPVVGRVIINWIVYKNVYFAVLVIKLSFQT